LPGLDEKENESMDAKAKNNIELPFMAAAIVAMLVFSFGCAQQPAAPPPGPSVTAPPGSVPDIHGCVPAQGYAWCEAKQKCYKPFDESCPSSSAAGTNSSPSVPPIPLPSAGNATPPAAANNTLPVSLPLPVSAPANSTMVVNITPNQSAAYYGVDPSELANITTMPTSNGVVPVVRDSHGCIPSINYLWCEATKKCYRPNVNICPSS